MKRREDQNFDLLEEIRKKAKEGIEIIEFAFENASSDADAAYVDVSSALVKRSELKKLAKLLSEVEVIDSLDEMRSVLTEESIPVEMILLDHFWGDFQILIYGLNEDHAN